MYVGIWCDGTIPSSHVSVKMLVETSRKEFDYAIKHFTIMAEYFSHSFMREMAMERSAKALVSSPR